MHNRVRMITASFLVKDLHLPWWWGARHFMRLLVDHKRGRNCQSWCASAMTCCAVAVSVVPSRSRLSSRNS